MRSNIRTRQSRLVHRWKDLHLIILFVIVYSFIVSFHLVRYIDKSVELDSLKMVQRPETDTSNQTRSAYDLQQNKLLIRDILMLVLENKDEIVYTNEKKSNGSIHLAGESLAIEGNAGPAIKEPIPPGHMGVPVLVDITKLSESDKKIYAEGWTNNKFNQFVSDMIPLRRELSDFRLPGCHNINYQWTLPSMSVVICFHNEAWSTLLRTVHSVIKTTPPHLLRQIILVDDFSTMDHLREPLDKYVSKFHTVKVIRTTQREGLVRARILGTASVVADVIMFLDSHCECIRDWAEPLLSRINSRPTAVVWPLIPSIDAATFEFKHDHDIPLSKGGFYWDLNFRWIGLQENDTGASVTSPIRSPTMAGGLFAINRKYFKHLGMYDPALELWGGENMELSFKVWMCGGSIEIIPCSVIGHVFRETSPMKYGSNVVRRNMQRVAEVWLDEYKTLYYDHAGVKLKRMGDISSQIKLRQKLQCRSFDWYIKQIYPQVFLPSAALQRGSIESNAVWGYCLDTVVKQAHNTAVVCDGCKLVSISTQSWYLTKIGEVRSGYNCLDVGLDTTFKTVRMGKCHGLQGNQYWMYFPENGTLYQYYTQYCLTLNKWTKVVSLEDCGKSLEQKWTWKTYISH